MNFNTPGMGTHGSEWQAHGYSGNGNVRPLIDSAKGRSAIVAGSSFQVFTDIVGILPRLHDPLIFAVNDIGMYLPRVDHWVTLHRNNLPAWRAVRWLHPKPEQHTETIYHSYEVDPNKYDFEAYSWDGLCPIFALSGYFAMQIAYIMGCGEIWLCGCPGSPTRRFYDTVIAGESNYPYKQDGGVRQQLVSEMNRLPEFRSRVRSMSGWTREFFGGLSGWRPSRV